MESRKTLGQMASFALVGAASYVLNAIVLVFCVEWLGLHYVVAMILSFVIVVSTAHLMNRRFTFGSKADYFTELGKYNVVNLAQFAIGLALMALLIEVGHLRYLVANALAAVILAVASFFVHRRWTFARRRSGNG